MYGSSKLFNKDLEKNPRIQIFEMKSIRINSVESFGRWTKWGEDYLSLGSLSLCFAKEGISNFRNNWINIQVSEMPNREKKNGREWKTVNERIRENGPNIGNGINISGHSCIWH